MILKNCLFVWFNTLTISYIGLSEGRLSSAVFGVVVNEHGLRASDGHCAVHVVVESHLEPPSRVLGVAGVL